MEVCEYLGLFDFCGVEYDVFKVIDKDIYYYEELKTGKIIRIELR